MAPYDKLKSENYHNLGGINTKTSPYVTGHMQFLNLVNVDFVAPGSLTKRPGTTQFIGSTVAGQVRGIFEFEQLNGLSMIIMSANTNVYNISSGTPVTIKTGVQNNGIFSFRTFVNEMFAVNGQDAFKYNGTNARGLFLPQGDTGAFGITAAVGGGLSGVILASYGYLNDRGYQGPVNTGYTISLNGITFGSITYYGLTSPIGLGVTAIQLYRSNVDLSVMFGTTAIPFGSTTFTDTGASLTNLVANFNLFVTLVPRYLELFNNQMVYAGFSTAPSRAYWSFVGEPEGIDPTFVDEFRTNDGDRITGLKNYQNSLVVTKLRSMARLVGDDPTNFLSQDLTDQYGCLSNRTLITYENTLLGLDSKGIFMFNGANLTVISTPIEPIFKTMNYDAAVENACGIHDKFRNMVMWAIPTNGATFNNTIICYDYLLESWTTYTGINPATIALVRGPLTQKTPFFGGYSGTISNFGTSLMGDNGQAITCIIQSRFVSELGNSIEKQWRRLFLNTDPITGTTAPINISLYSNYEAVAPAATYTMYQAPFQSRIDFGISSKSFAFGAVQSSATLSFRLHGFSIDYRFQRAV